MNIAMTRLYGRAPRGERAVGSAPKNYGEKVTMLGALSVAGLDALMTVDGATDTAVFAAFVREVLSPTLCEGDFVVLDNLSAHHSQATREAVAARGARTENLLYAVRQQLYHIEELRRVCGARPSRSLHISIRTYTGRD